MSSSLNDSFFLSFTHPEANGFAPPILGRDIGITFEEIQAALNKSIDQRKVGLITTPLDEQNIELCMKKLKLLNPIQQYGQKRSLQRDQEGGAHKRTHEEKEQDMDVVEATDDLLNGGR